MATDGEVAGLKAEAERILKQFMVDWAGEFEPALNGDGDDGDSERKLQMVDSADKEGEGKGGPEGWRSSFGGGNSGAEDWGGENGEVPVAIRPTTHCDYVTTDGEWDDFIAGRGELVLEDTPHQPHDSAVVAKQPTAGGPDPSSFCSSSGPSQVNPYLLSERALLSNVPSSPQSPNRNGQLQPIIIASSHGPPAVLPNWILNNPVLSHLFRGIKVSANQSPANPRASHRNFSADQTLVIQFHCFQTP